MKEHEDRYVVVVVEKHTLMALTLLPVLDETQAQICGSSKGHMHGWCHHRSYNVP